MFFNLLALANVAYMDTFALFDFNPNALTTNKNMAKQVCTKYKTKYAIHLYNDFNLLFVK